MKFLLEDRCQVCIKTVSGSTGQKNNGTADGDPFIQKKLKLFQDTSCFQTVLTWQFHKQKRQQSQSRHKDRDKSRTPSKNMSDGGSDRHTDNRSDTEARKNTCDHTRDMLRDGSNIFRISHGDGNHSTGNDSRKNTEYQKYHVIGSNGTDQVAECKQ